MQCLNCKTLQNYPIKQTSIVTLAPPTHYPYLWKLLNLEYLRFICSDLGFKFLFMHAFYSWHLRRETSCQAQYKI